MSGLDKFSEKMTRRVARATSRRSLLTLIGGALTGAATIPVLPVSRAQAQGHGQGGGGESIAPQPTGNPQDPGDQTQCDY